MKENESLKAVVFAFPVEKLYVSCCGPATEGVLSHFLSRHFKTFTATTVSRFICWYEGRKEIEYNECRLYEVSNASVGRIELLQQELARIARATGLDRIYCKVGDEALLIRPDQPVLTERVV